MIAEKYALLPDGEAAGTRLFVGSLSMDSSGYAPEAGDEVLVGFGHAPDAHAAPGKR
jgi:hypothetical protein